MGKVKKNEDPEKKSVNKSSFGINNSPNIATEIKSVAIVKYSEVTAPALFTRLRCNTDLNLLPSNWLSNSVESYGLRPASFFHRPGFSSFRMAHMFPDCVGEVDVVSDAENIKKLLKIPYSHGSVSMMIHRIENTLLIDEFDVHKYLLREAECQWEWFKKFFIENIMESANAKDKLIHHRDNSRISLQEKSLVSKFLYHSLVVADTNKQKIEKTDSNFDNVKSATPLPLTFKNDPPLPDPSLEEESPDPTSNHKFARNVVWTFEDIQMLLGTDMPIFGGGTHPCISLRLRDMTKPINVLTGMDYWLDNLMCNVPEVIMCYHLNGIVQKYELIKTEDLPHLENSKFSPKVIRDIAQNILSFLKSNATKAGHTYWLFKGKDDDVVKLYDLTSLCTDALDEKGQTPFTVPVAMLLYRVARNMKNSSDGQRQAATIRLLLKNCLSLLSPEKYPEIVTSSHYMLADLYIPAGINPASPELCSFELNTSDETNYETQFVQDLEKEEVAIKSLSLASISETHLEEMECITPPLPVALDLEIRCKDSLRHVLHGLKSLKFLNEFDQKKENTKIKSEVPYMARPFQKIPMPYQSLSKENEDEKKMKRKRNKKKKKNVQGDEEKEDEDELPNISLLWKPTIYLKKALPTLQIQTPNNTVSWNIHLKTLLYEKICLVYATLMEKSYSDGKFGLTLQYIKIILRGRKVLNTLQEGLYKDIESYLLGQAGDALFMIIKNFQKLEIFDLEYSSFMDIDQEILLELKEENLEKNLIEEEVFPQNLKNLEELLLKSRRCYQKALECELCKFDKESLLRRLGNIENELGVFYMNQAAAKYHKEIILTKTVLQVSTYSELFKKSRQHLDIGIQIFDRVKDEANIALLYSNTGRLMRVQAHFASLTEIEDNEFLIQEKCFYKKSISYYQKALQVLGDRKYNLTIWDLINWELSTTLFSLASLLQDYPISINNKEMVEKELIEILHKALKYCDVNTPGLRQPVYQYRKALIHHRLASLYHKLYRFNAEDNTRKKKLQQLCNRHYEKSIKLLLYLENSSEYLRVQLERVAFFEFKAEGAPSDTVKIKHYQHGLKLLLEATTILKIISERDLEFYKGEDDQLSEKSKQNIIKSDCNKEEIKDILESKSELENEIILLKLYEQRLQFILMFLTKLNLNRNVSKKGSENLGEIYKKLYELSLRSNYSKDDPVKLSKSLFITVTNILKTLNLNSNLYYKENY